MKVISKQKNSHDCIICGMDNELGLHAHFYNTEDNKVVSKVVFKFEHQSYPGRTHGGMISALLDELIGRAIWIKDENAWGVTIKLEVRYRKPVPYGVPLMAFGELISETSRTFTGSGYIKDLDGNILAEATGTYMRLPIDKITDANNEHAEMFLIEDDITEI